MSNYKKLQDYLPEFAEALKNQLDEDEKHWGDTWQGRDISGQELRTEARFIDYFAQFKNARVPVPWLKIACGALICWVRERVKNG